jgi:asparagine synthase (glutamine-hydrolysing)
MESMLLYFTLAYVPTPRTIWKNARKLPPGHWLLIENNEIQIEHYWGLRPALHSGTSKKEFIEKIDEILLDSIKLHSRSDVPVGTLLSGGLDSSAITALFCQRTNKPVHTFSMDFEGKDFNEGHFAKLVADRYHTVHHPYTLKLEQALLELDNLLPLMDEPMADSAIIPSYYLSKWAREENITVILCGAGGDELFGGYHRHYRGKRDLVAGRLSAISLSFWRFMGRMINSKIMHYGSLSWDKGTAFGIGTSGVHLGMFDYMLNNSSTLANAMVLTKEKFSYLFAMENDFGLGYGRMLTDIQNYLVDNVLAITDKTSMAASVEARVPLLDHRLVELAFSVPPEVNLGRDFQHFKKSLKNAVDGILPTPILNRPKTGFNAPVNSWIHSGNNSIGERLSNLKHPALLEIFNQQTISDIWSDERKRDMASESLFMLFIADNWLESHA